jgi:hypothetical protein
VKEPLTAAAVVAAPSFGPAVVTLGGIQVPVVATGLSIAALVLARWIAPPPLRRLTGMQQLALTLLLVIFLFLAVTGQLPLIGGGKPLGPGMAVVWGAGFGFSGLLVIEMIGERTLAMLRAMFGSKVE